jgi:hypothetical protein
MCGKSRTLRLSLGRQCRTGRSEPVMAVALSLLNRNAQWQAAAGSCTRGLCAARTWNWSGTLPSHTQQGSAAVAEPQKILDHRGLLWIARPAHWLVWVSLALYARDEKRKLRPASEPGPPTMISSCYGKMPRPTSGPERSQSGIGEVAVAGLLRRSLAQFGNYGCCAWEEW